MMSQKNNVLIAKRVVQNNQEFLISVLPVSQLWRYTKYTERIIVGFDEENYPVYNLEIQRKTDSNKVRLIAEYLIRDPDAIFPTNIVLAIPSLIIVDMEENDGEVKITFDPIVEEELKKNEGDVYISVIDGQHRLKGIEEAITLLRNEIAELDPEIFPNKIKNKKKLLDNILKIELPVTFFIDPVLEYQASIFSTINRTQTKVSENLVYSLFGLTDKTSPQKTALEVTLALNSARKSPFFNRIKLVGKKYIRGESPVLSQAAIVKSLVRCICPSIREAERERFKKRSELKKGINHNLCFRDYYASDDDVKITKIMVAFFSAVEETWKDQNDIAYWDLNSKSNILQTTVGYESLLNLMKSILANLKKEKGFKDDDLFDTSIYKKYLKKVTVDFTDFGRYPKTSVTKNVLLQDMKTQLDIE